MSIQLLAQSKMEQSLTTKQKSIIPIAAFTANGDQLKLKTALITSLDNGLTINEIKEILVHLYAYAGFPRSLNAISTFENVIKERQQKGIKDVIGKEASPINFNGNKFEFGKNVQTILTTTTATGSAQKFVPLIDTFLKEHLFADIFGRDILDYQSREIATISALGSIDGLANQLAGHLFVGKNVGLTQNQLNEIADILSIKIGKPKGDMVKEMIKPLFKTDMKNTTSTQIKNPFGLVYDGAITENIKGKVNIHPFTYKLNGIDIAANVYTPANYDASKKYAAIVVAHPNGGVKEQTAGLYAQFLAEQGYITLASDAAYQGASGGEPRHTDKPQFRTEDIHGMADFITQFAGVDANRLGVLGICGGGGYSLKAVQSDKRFKAVATLSMFNSGEVRRNGFQNSLINTIQDRLQQATKARAQEMNGGEIMYSGIASITDEEIAKTPTDLYREGYTYYYRNYS
ncbi:MAG TPA: carboxymuconolactone decarboxylase family protein, partial [Chitinophagales bacterium]|nr:carboxymuconolactone decarboxylase family protein [Chitinophagales bacterium]